MIEILIFKIFFFSNPHFCISHFAIYKNPKKSEKQSACMLIEYHLVILLMYILMVIFIIFQLLLLFFQIRVLFIYYRVKRRLEKDYNKNEKRH